MTDPYGPTDPVTPRTTPSQLADEDQSTTDTAKDQASGVAHEAADRGRDVAQTASHEAKQVGREASDQARGLLNQVRSDAYDQAGHQQMRIADGLRSLGTEFSAMAEGSRDSEAESGTATRLTGMASDRLESVAGWLDDRSPADLLDEVRRYARRNPGTFLLGAALVGLVAGRVTRSLTDDARDDSDGSDDADETRRRRGMSPNVRRQMYHPDRLAGAESGVAGTYTGTYGGATGNYAGTPGAGATGAPGAYGATTGTPGTPYANSTDAAIPAADTGLPEAGTGYPVASDPYTERERP